MGRYSASDDSGYDSASTYDYNAPPVIPSASEDSNSSASARRGRGGGGGVRRPHAGTADTRRVAQLKRLVVHLRDTLAEEKEGNAYMVRSLRGRLRQERAAFDGVMAERRETAAQGQDEERDLRARVAARRAEAARLRAEVEAAEHRAQARAAQGTTERAETRMRELYGMLQELEIRRRGLRDVAAHDERALAQLRDRLETVEVQLRKLQAVVDTDVEAAWAGAKAVREERGAEARNYTRLVAKLEARHETHAAVHASYLDTLSAGAAVREGLGLVRGGRGGPAATRHREAQRQPRSPRLS